MRSLVALVTLLSIACNRPPAPPPAPVGRAAVDAGPARAIAERPDADIPPPDAVVARPDAVEDAPPAPSPRASLLRDLAAGRTSIAAHTDPARGVLVIEFVEPGPQPRGRGLRSARRLCGREIARDRDLPRMFQNAIAQAEHFPLRCEDDLCTVEGMEYAPVWRVHFAGDAITAVMRLSEAAMGDDFLAARDAVVRRHLDAQRATPCAGAAP